MKIGSDQPIEPTPDKPCVHFNTAGIEVVIGLACIMIMAVVAILVMKSEAKDIIISAVSVMGGWLGKTGYDAATANKEVKP